MQILTVSRQNREYPVYKEDGLIAQSAALLSPAVKGRKVFVITDAKTYEQSSKELIENLSIAGGDVRVITVDSAERAKKMSQAEKLVSTLLDNGLTCQDVPVALGGSAVLSLTAFCAFILMGGISYISVPTTPQAQLCDALYGYACLNTPQGKNTIRFFAPPQMVLLDTAFFPFLTDKEALAGLASLIAYAASCDADLFQTIMNTDTDQLDSVSLMSEVIRQKIQKISEGASLASLSYGESIADCLEYIGGYNDIAYGDALLHAMYRLAQIGERDRKTVPGTAAQLLKLYEKHGLLSPLPPVDEEELRRALAPYFSSDHATAPICFLQKIGASSMEPTTADDLLPKAYENRKRLEIQSASPAGTVRIPPCADMGLRMMLASHIAGDDRPFSLTDPRYPLLIDALSALSKDGEFSIGAYPALASWLVPLSLSELGGVTMIFDETVEPSRFSALVRFLETQGIYARIENNRFYAYGRIKGGDFQIENQDDPELLTGLLMVLPTLKENSSIMITGDLGDIRYTDMTISALKRFGIGINRLSDRSLYVRGGQQYSIPPVAPYIGGDYEIASAYLAMSALGNPVECLMLTDGKHQDAASVLSVAEHFGAEVIEKNGNLSLSPLAFGGVGIDISLSMSLFPFVLCLASVAQGESRIFNTDILKEHDPVRYTRIVTAFQNLGAAVREEGDYIAVLGRKTLPGGAADTTGDPILALTLVALSTRCENTVVLLGGQCIEEKVPDYIEQLNKLGYTAVEDGKIE